MFPLPYAVNLCELIGREMQFRCGKEELCSVLQHWDDISDAVIIIQLGDSTPLQVTIEGTGRVEACIRENITYTCNVSGLAHIWNAPGLLPPNTVVTPTTTEFVTSRYTLRLVSNDGANIISSLTVISDVGFNNTNVTCADPFGNEFQQTLAILAIVLGFMGSQGHYYFIDKHDTI